MIRTYDMRTVFQTSERPRDCYFGWAELARVLGRPEASVRNAPPNWLAAIPCWKVAGVRCWETGEIANALAGSKPTTVRNINRWDT
ncbi:hypothetical protein GCM10027288_11790 [Bordetella tumbae]